MVDVYKALGHPVRLRILAMLASGELCACQITAVLKLAASTVSAHLGELRRAGVLVERKEGRWVIFRHSDDEARALIATALASLGGDTRIEADARIVRHLRRVSVEKLCRAELDLARVGNQPSRRRRRARACASRRDDNDERAARLNVFERYLSLWVAACMVAGRRDRQARPGLVGRVRGHGVRRPGATSTSRSPSSSG